MDKKIIIQRIDELMEEKRISKYALKENTEISSTIYQWRKNTARDATRTPSLRSIERVCEFLGVSLSYFFAFEKEEQKKAKLKEFIELAETLSAQEIEAIECVMKLIKRE
ncbi:MAG: helix-turn-helix domain-containing protein [Christensenellaceae bacterium]|jgi:hypothetical protein|nr:MAG: hypothetical protein DBY05_06405 [Clostridiales bacterium]